MIRNDLATTGVQTAQLIISIDDFSPRNMEIAEIMMKSGIAGIFFIECMKKEARDQIKALSGLGFEIGSHTLSHPPDIKLLDIEQQRGEIESSKTIIQDITGRPCTVFAYPRGRYSDQTVALVKAAGYEYARTTQVGATYWADDYRMPTSVHMFDGRKEYKGKRWTEIAYTLTEQILNTGGIMHIWGHAEEMNRNDAVGEFKKYIEHVRPILQNVS